MRPEFIERSAFREWMKPHQMNKYLMVDGIQASSYVARCYRMGDPIRSRFNNHLAHYRVLDVVARARARGHTISLPKKKQILDDIAHLEHKKQQLEDQVAERKHHLALSISSSRLTGATLLSEAEILAGAMALPATSAVYFLIQGNRVVYVGPAANVHKRLGEHKDKEFDRFACIPCHREQLDVLESLYIHALRPALNGKWHNAVGMHAPLRLDALMGHNT